MIKAVVKAWPGKEMLSEPTVVAFLPAFQINITGADEFIPSYDFGNVDHVIPQFLWFVKRPYTSTLGYRWLDRNELIFLSMQPQADHVIFSVVNDNYGRAEVESSEDFESELVGEGKIFPDGTLQWVKYPDVNTIIGEFAKVLIEAISQKVEPVNFGADEVLVFDNADGCASFHRKYGDTIIRAWEIPASETREGKSELVCRRAWVCTDKNSMPIVDIGIMGKVYWDGVLEDEVLYCPSNANADNLRFAKTFAKQTDIHQFVKGIYGNEPYC